MPCTSPLVGYRAVCPNENGKYPISFSIREGYSDLPIDVPCGQCLDCRLKRSSVWASRIMQEAKLHKNNCFITLTYSDDCLPPDFGLRKEHFQGFMKRLRHIAPHVRYFHCGEYGDKTSRPHYHACIFNYDFPDKVHFTNRNGHKVYTSKILEKTWGFGICEIGDLTFDSAAYVARYVVKKLSISDASSDEAVKAFMDKYTWLNLETGEFVVRPPEYITMSLKPAIGREWWEKYKRSPMDTDRIVVDGRVLPLPRYYDKLFEIDDPVRFAQVKAQRVINAKKMVDKEEGHRYLVKREVTRLKAKQLVRPLL